MSDKKTRAARIRARERGFSALRSAVVPFVVIYGLFIQRPKEYNFANYLAMRRKYEPSFDSLFPPVATAVKTKNIFSRHSELGNGADGTREVVGTSNEDSRLSSEYVKQLEGFFVSEIKNEKAAQVQLCFRSYLLFGVGTVRLTSTAGETRSLRFLGVLGSFWKEL